MRKGLFSLRQKNHVYSLDTMGRGQADPHKIQSIAECDTCKVVFYKVEGTVSVTSTGLFYEIYSAGSEISFERHVC